MGTEDTEGGFLLFHSTVCFFFTPLVGLLEAHGHCCVVLCCVVRESRVLRITRARRCGERWCDSGAAVQLRSARLVRQHLRKWLRIHQGNFCTFSHPLTFQGSSLEAFGRKDNTKLNKTWLLDFWLCARFVYAEILVRKTNQGVVFKKRKKFNQ